MAIAIAPRLARRPPAPNRRAHLEWLIKKARAHLADRTGRAFTYVHPGVGRIVYHPSDWLSWRLFLYGDFEAPELRFATEQASKGGIILDVGANIGLYAVACARAVGVRGRVLALEPGPRTFGKLSDTCARLGLSNILPLRVAAGAINGSATLVTSQYGRDVHQHLVDARASDDAQRVRVEMARLDDVCGHEVAEVVLMKLDVEGHEVDALKGAEQVLANGRVHLIVEFYPAGLAAAGASPDELWALLCRTHDCAAIVRQDGSTLPPLCESLVPREGEDAFNTLWLPREAPVRSGSGDSC